MVTDRHVLVVRQKWVVGPELLADVLGMVDADVEVGVVADLRWQMQCAGGRLVQERSDPAAFGTALAEQLGEGCAQGAARRGAEREQRVEASARGGLGRCSGRAREQVRGEQSRQIQDGIANRDAGPRRALRRREDAERQVLDREVRVAGGTRNPGPQGGIVGMVESVQRFGSVCHRDRSHCRRSVPRVSRVVTIAQIPGTTITAA